MEYSIVNYSNLETVSSRLDAEYYRPLFLDVERKVKKQKWDCLINLTESIKSFGAYSLCNQVEYKDKGIPFLRCKDIKNGLVDLSDVLYIDNDTNQLLWKSEVKPQTVLFTMSGTVGNSAIATEDLKYPMNSNQDIAKIVVNERLNPYYLCIFLQSRYGKQHISRLPIGSVQQHIFLWQLERLPIPLFSNEFQKIVQAVFKLLLASRKNAEEKYSQALVLLLSELGLSEWKPNRQLSFIRNYSETQQAGRFDAEYFQPMYREVEKHLISECSAKKIGDIDFIKLTTGQYTDSYTDEKKGVPYIRGTNLSMGTIDETDIFYIDPKMQIKSKKAKEGDVIVTRVGTIGLAARIPKKYEGGTISDNIIRLRFDQSKLNSFFLATYLGSILGQNLMIGNSRGSVQQRLNQETFKEITIPLIPMEKQEHIASLVEKAEELRELSKTYLEHAKKAVEIAIEKNEDSAIKWLETLKILV